MGSSARLEKNIAVAHGDLKADLVLKNASIINVFTESIEKGDIAISEGSIAGIGSYHGEEEIDLAGNFVCPGFIDGHIHLESSMMTPLKFEKTVLPHGTTAVVADPHEIANIAGLAGIQYMLKQTENLDLDVFLMIPSCVPSTDLDESGARIDARTVAGLLNEKRVLGLAEVMNSHAVISRSPDLLKKLTLTLAQNRIIDGHAPLLSGRELNAYITAGIRSDHECSLLEEAQEKIARGLWIMVREGTAARNLEHLMPLLHPPYHQRVMLVTDDKHPGQLLREGHIDAIIRKAIQKGADPVLAIKTGTLNPATYFGLSDRGAIAPGYQADLVVLSDLKEIVVKSVYKAGRLVSDGITGKPADCIKQKWTEDIEERVFNSFQIPPITLEQLNIVPRGINQRVIDLSSHELITSERITAWRNFPGFSPGVDISRDIVKIAVFERHKRTGHAGIGFIGKYGLKMGAVASSIGHDSHNLIIAGTNDRDMAAAGNQVIKNKGGLAIALEGKIVADLALPIAGLMSDRPAAEIDERLELMKDILKDFGISPDIDAFMTLAFISLPVIPVLRINTFGIIDVVENKIVESSF